MLSSATACAPITAHNTTGSVTNLVSFAATGSASDGGGGAASSPVAASTGALVSAASAGGAAPGGASGGDGGGRNHHGLAERFHGLTERIGSLGHSRTDSDVSNRTRTGIYGI